MKVIGYVDTGYANRTQEAVRDDLDRWFVLYPAIQGFFFDRQSPSAQHVDYYRGLAGYARHKLRNTKALVVGNPGTMCDLNYFNDAVLDVTCIFASFEGFDDINPPVLPKEPGPSRTAAFVYQIPDAKAMRRSSRKPSTRGSATSTSPMRRRVATPGPGSPATGTMRSRPSNPGDRPPVISRP